MSHEQLTQECRNTIIRITKWYLEHIHSLPYEKHIQFIRVTNKLQDRHNRLAEKSQMQPLFYKTFETETEAQ